VPSCIDITEQHSPHQRHRIELAHCHLAVRRAFLAHLNRAPLPWIRKTCATTAHMPLASGTGEFDIGCLYLAHCHEEIYGTRYLR
jgi:hypothetical protein